MGRKSENKPELSISYKISNETLQLKLSWGQLEPNFIETKILPNGRRKIDKFQAGINANEKINAGFHKRGDFVRYTPLYISTGFKKKDWNKKKKKLSNSIKQLELDSFVQKIYDTYEYWRDATDGDIPTKEIFKGLIKNIARRTDLDRVPTYKEVAEKQSKTFIINGELNKKILPNMPFVDYMKFKITDWKVNNRKRSSTIRNYSGILNFIQEFEKNVLKHPLLVKQLNEEILEKFFNYIPKIKTYSIGYLNKIFRQMRMFGNAIINEEKIPLKIYWKANFFPRNVEHVEEVALEWDELLQLTNLQIPEKKTGWIKIKDLFIFGCLTGLRKSDLNSTNVIKVNNQWVVQQAMKKTRESVRIPVHKIAEEIFLKYNQDLPVINDQKFNKEIKSICKEAGLNKKVKVYRSDTQNGNLIVKEYPMYELIKSSTCRRTFATLLITKWGLSPMEAKGFTGHLNLKAFLTYIRIKGESSEQLLARRFAMD